MGMTAENALSVALFCVAERALSYLRREAQPSGVETVKVAGKPFFLGIDLLQPDIDELSEIGQLEILDYERVELMAMDGQMLLSLVVPGILLVNGNADQVRHHIGKTVIVIALHPDHLHVVLGVGELADVTQKLPMLLSQAAEVEIGKDIAQQDQTSKLDRVQKIQRVCGPADFRPQMQVRKNYRVVFWASFPHAPF